MIRMLWLLRIKRLLLHFPELISYRQKPGNRYTKNKCCSRLIASHEFTKGNAGTLVGVAVLMGGLFVFTLDKLNLPAWEAKRDISVFLQ